MSYRDLYLLSLLALGYLCLDSRRAPASVEDLPPPRPAPRPLAAARTAAGAPGTAVVVHAGRTGTQLVPVRVRSEPTCPRSPEHPVHVRHDGALWCRSCDRGFFPTLPGLEGLASAA